MRRRTLVGTETMPPGATEDGAYTTREDIVPRGISGVTASVTDLMSVHMADDW